jgi:glucose-6-phosphate isomerase
MPTPHLSAPSSADTPDFRAATFLQQHALWTMAFYEAQSVDTSGGMYHFYLDDGRVYNPTTRHLVSATRFVITNAIAYELSGEEKFKARAAHALRFVETAFYDAAHDGYHWTISWQDGKATPIDTTRHMYGLAFIMLAAAKAVQLGIPGAQGLLERTFALAERRFYDPASGLYADDASADWTLSGYRGQNANMHTCEALITAFAATQDARYIQRAESIALRITVRQAALCGGGIWEHYNADWTPDLDYNRFDSSNIFRPWGFQPGHFTEWAKLLCLLDTHLQADWHVPRAQELFDRALAVAWDAKHGGIHYGFGLDNSICDAAKYHWVQAESMAAAAILALRTGDAKYWDWYDRLWQYCWQHFVDHQQGAWFRILTADNFNLTREKSPAGKVDYHNIGACYDVFNALKHA